MMKKMPLRLLPCSLRVIAFAALLPQAALLPAAAQTHVVEKPESVVRAIAVYEWTGDPDKASASRIIPVSIFVDGRLRDAGIYLARPVPLALDTGTVFEVEHAGRHQGTLELAFARNLTSTGDQENDNTWFGYGLFKPKPKPVEMARAKTSGRLPQIVVSGGKGPHFGTQPAAGTTKSEAAADAPKAAAVDRSGAASGTVSTDPADGDKAEVDPDSAQGNPDRPTLRRRTPQQQKEAQKKSQQAAVFGVGSLNDDPDRPVLHRGREQSPEEELKPLLGIPAGMHQAVAVSDAKDRPEHDFDLEWESDVERAQMLSTMQAFARTRLAAYSAHLLPAKIEPGPSARPAKAATPAGKTPVRRPRRVAHNHVDLPPAPPQALLNEESLTAYTLSYGGDPTFVYTASSPGEAGVTRYVTVVAQRSPTGEVKVALTSATDSAHLDRTARMLLVDVVDVTESNRASLLFELRAQNTRQFALYRVLGAEAEQTFATDNIPIGAPARGTTLLHH